MLREWSCRGRRRCAICAAFTLVLLAAGLLPTRGQVRAPIVHKSGLGVVPVYEGWYKNPDGTISLSFGYLNRNYEEELDVPIGPENRIEPGPEDQGQPTHFYPRRQRGVFVVTLPAGAANKNVIWTLSARGETASVPANLGQLYVIDALRSEGRGRVPPGLKLESSGQVGVGPGGVKTARKAVLPQAVALDAWVTDPDPVQTGSGFPRGVTLTWSKYRGPGAVTFASGTLSVDTADKALTSATFSEPGEYVLRVLAMGAEMDPTTQTNQCCWTNGYVQVSVSATK